MPSFLEISGHFSAKKIYTQVSTCL